MKRILFLLLFIPIGLFAQKPVVSTNVSYATSIFPYDVDSANWEAEYKTIYYAIAKAERPRLDTANFQNIIIKSFKETNIEGTSTPIWDTIDIFYITAQRTVAGAYLNWMNPGTYDLTDGSGSTDFTKYQGFDSDGATDYLNTNFITGTNYINTGQNNITFGFYLIGTNFNDPNYKMGAEDASEQIMIRARYSGNINSIMNAGTGVTGSAGGTSNGFTLSTRRGATEIEIYKNGASMATDVDASTGVVTVYPLTLLAYNDASVIGSFLPDGAIITMAIVMGTVSDNDAATINTIIEQYMDNIGIGVE